MSFPLTFFPSLAKRTFFRGDLLRLREESSQKRFRPLFCFPDHPIDYEGGPFFLFNKKQGEETIHMESKSMEGFLLSLGVISKEQKGICLGYKSFCDK